jgi:chromate transporter
VLFGSGYVLVALLRSELVDGLGWLTETQLLDAIAVGQATPGPLFSTATFVGYVIAGPVGALLATVGVFVPAFVAVAVSIPLLGRLRRSRPARAFLDGVNIAAVGLLGIVAVQLAIASLRDPIAVATALVAFVLLLRGVGTVWLVGAGAVVAVIRLVAAPG